MCPHHLTKEQKGYLYENAQLFLSRSDKIVTNLEYQNYLTVDGTWIYKFEPKRPINKIKQWVCNWIYQQGHLMEAYVHMPRVINSCVL